VLLGSAGTLALLLALAPSLRESAVASLTGRSADEENVVGNGDGDGDEKDEVRRRGTAPNAPCEDSSAAAACRNGGQQDQLMDSVDLPLRMLSKAEGVVQYRSTLLVVIERCVNDFNYSAILRTAEALGIQDVWLVDPPSASRLPAPPVGDDVLLVENGERNENTTTNEEDCADGADEDDSTVGDATSLPQQNGSLLSQSTIPRWMTEQERTQRSAHHLFAQNATSWLSIREFQTSAECLRELRSSGYQVWATDLSQKAVPLSRECVPETLPNRGKIAVVFGTEAVGVSQEMLDDADLRVYLPLRGFADSLNLSVAAALVIQQVLQLYPGLIGNHPHKDELRRQWYPKLASQRMWTPRQKKGHRKLRNLIADCQLYLRQQRQGLALAREQLVKLDRLPEWEAQIKAMEREVSEAAQAAVEQHVRHPPPPLTDLRRADEHRVPFVGKNTKLRHKEHWVGMAATSNRRTQHMSSANAFRNHHKLATNDSCDEAGSHAAP
jgi:tRNA G18 (ribose-2'-O)-methylase SpoU